MMTTIDAEYPCTESSSELQAKECMEENITSKPAPFFAYRDHNSKGVTHRDTGNISSDEGSGSDDSNASGDGLWKRRRRRSPPAPRPSAPSPSNGRRNNVWGQVLAEQSLTEDIRGFCGVQAALPCNERAVESYRYWTDHQPIPKRPLVVQPNRRKRKAVTEETDDSVADCIAEALNEPKRMLIGQVVSVIGRDKAIELLENTKDVEANGGMTIMNGSRRRTPGGVYFQLLKSDPEITSEQIEEIFEEERKALEKAKKRRKAVRRREKAEKLKALVEDQDALIPLPTHSELTLLQHKAKNECRPDTEELEPGEIVDDDLESTLPNRTDVDMG